MISTAQGIILCAVTFTEFSKLILSVFIFVLHRWIRRGKLLNCDNWLLDRLLGCHLSVERLIISEVFFFLGVSTSILLISFLLLYSLIAEVLDDFSLCIPKTRYQRLFIIFERDAQLIGSLVIWSKALKLFFLRNIDSMVYYHIILTKRYLAKVMLNLCRRHVKSLRLLSYLW